VNPAGLQPMPRPVRLAGRLLLRRLLLNPILPKVWQGILANVFYEDNEYTRAFIRTCQDTYDPEDVYEISLLMQALRPDLLSRDYASLLPQLTTPTWLIWGTKDRLVPAKFLRKAARKLPQVTIEELPRCGHMPIIERPDRVIAFLEHALRR